MLFAYAKNKGTEHRAADQHFCFCYIPYKGKFSRRLIFAVFRGKSCTAKIKNHEIFSKFVQSSSKNSKVLNDTILHQLLA